MPDRGRMLPVLGLAIAVVVALIAALVVIATTSGSSGGPSAGSPGGPDDASRPGAVRNIYARPFAWDSIWNLPLSTAAVHRPFNSRPQGMYPDLEDISVDPSTPVKTLDSPNGTSRVHVDPQLAADGEFNNCATFLVDTPDRRTIVQGQPLKLEPGGDPSYQYTWPAQPLTGAGTLGCHGGSSLSGIGGSLRKGEISSPDPIQHALKINLNCEVNCSNAGGGFRWPAVKADKDHDKNYGGRNPDVQMGSLLALDPNEDLDEFTRPDVRKVAEALRTYGAYVVDSTGGPETNSLVIEQGAQPELPDMDSDEMKTMISKLSVVVNNTPQTPGGGPLGSPRLASCAGPFQDGTGGAPQGC